MSLQEINFNQSSPDIKTMVEVLGKMNVVLEGRVESLAFENEYLKEKLGILTQKYFGRKSEKLSEMPWEQLDVFNEVEVEAKASETSLDLQADVTIPEHTRKARGKRGALPEHLRREEKIVDLADADKVCVNNHALTRIGEEVHEHLELIPKQVYVVVTKRQKYACKTCEETVKVAAILPTILPKTNCGASLLAYLVTSKYCDHLPLYRLEDIFGRIDLDLRRQTMARWMVDAAQKLTPIINLLQDKLFESTYLQMDETRIQVIGEKAKAIDSDKYIWVRRKPGEEPIVLYNYHPSRGGIVPLELLPGYSGILQVDGYVGYDDVIDKQSLIRMGCMAHLRRYFFEVFKAKGKHSNLANRVLQLIKKLYQVEEEARAQNLSADQRQSLRQEKSTPVMDLLKNLIDEYRPKVPPQSALGKALTYATNQWSFVIVYLTDGRIEIDNNLIENAIRPFAIGRKNWLFSATVDGAHASCVFYSLIQTAKENNIEPYAYLKNLFEKIPLASTLQDYEYLLPLPRG